MPIDQKGDIEELQGRAGSDHQLAESEDISDGVETDIDDVSGFTIFLSSDGSMDVTVEFSPDGTHWFEPRSESPISFTAANEEVIRVEYDVSAVRLTGSNQTTLDAQIREVV